MPYRAQYEYGPPRGLRSAGLGGGESLEMNLMGFDDYDPTIEDSYMDEEFCALARDEDYDRLGPSGRFAGKKEKAKALPRSLAVEVAKVEDIV